MLIITPNRSVATKHQRLCIQIDLFDMKTLLETMVYTCQYPMLGRVVRDYDDCLWNLYPVEYPLMDSKSLFPVLKMLDLEGDIFPWTCSYDYYAAMRATND